MKRKIVIAGAIILLTLVGASVIAFTKKDSVPKNATSLVPRQGPIAATIEMKDEDMYTPNKVTIKVGQAVRFVNKSTSDRWPASNVHPSHTIYSEFDPKRHIKPGEEWIFTFERVGAWRMHDHLRPFSKGLITVEPL